MRQPRFWSAPPSAPHVLSRLLSPLATLSARSTANRVARPPDYVAPVPVICVGNLNVGGTGKTPTAIAIAEQLRSATKRPAFVSRGYGGSKPGPIKVDPENHGASEVGDEPLLLSAFAQTYISRNRALGARMAVDDGATVLILDDGFQNPSVAKTASLIVVDAQEGFGNGRVMPAGPLREPVEAGLARADAIILIGSASAQTHFLNDWGDKMTIPVLTARLDPLNTGMPWTGMRVFAFAGIGRPAKFFETMQDLGAELAGQIALSDHQPISDTLWKRLEADARAAGAQLVTTEKDAARLSPARRAKVRVVPVRLSFDNPKALGDILATAQIAL